MTQLTVLPVAFAAVPATVDSDEKTFAAKPRGSGSGSTPAEELAVTGGCDAGSVVPSGKGEDCDAAATAGAVVAAGAAGTVMTGASGRARGGAGRATGNGAAPNVRSGGGA
jgi:hypothetical protein